MIKLGVIESSTSSYSSGIVLVPIKDNSVSVCVDYRTVNKLTEFDADAKYNENHN